VLCKAPKANARRLLSPMVCEAPMPTSAPKPKPKPPLNTSPLRLKETPTIPIATKTRLMLSTYDSDNSALRYESLRQPTPFQQANNILYSSSKKPEAYGADDTGARVCPREAVNRKEVTASDSLAKNSAPISTFAPLPPTTVTNPEPSRRAWTRACSTCRTPDLREGRPSPAPEYHFQFQPQPQQFDPGHTPNNLSTLDPQEGLHLHLGQKAFEQADKGNMEPASRLKGDIKVRKNRRHSKQGEDERKERNRANESSERLFHIPPLAPDGFGTVHHIIREPKERTIHHMEIHQLKHIVQDHNNSSRKVLDRKDNEAKTPHKEPSIARELKSRHIASRASPLPPQQSMTRSDAEKRRVWVGQHGRFSQAKLQEWYAGMQSCN
jgi:hypothetical protein